MKTSTRLALVLLLFALALWSVAKGKTVDAVRSTAPVAFEVAVVDAIAPPLEHAGHDLQRLFEAACVLEAALEGLDARLPSVPVRTNESVTARVGETATQSL